MVPGQSISTTTLIIAAGLIGTGALLVFTIFSNDAEAPQQNEALLSSQSDMDSNGHSISNLAQELSSLRIQINEEKAAREKLAQRVATLQAQLPVLHRALDKNEAHGSLVDESETSSNPSFPSLITTENSVQQTSEALTTLGLTPARIEQVQHRNSELEMKMLYLRNQAVREGWIGTERYVAERQKLSQAANPYREELGEADYDRFLFMTGQANRVVVQNVIGGSPAEKAGISNGDIIVSYADKRIFSWNDLTSETANGETGQLVPIRIRRDENLLDVYVPRGPLGVRLDMMSVEPS